MFGKIKWLTLILPVLFLVTCTLGEDLENRGSVTVTFNANGGSGPPPAAQTGNIGASITLPNSGSLSRENHTFGGWNTNAEGTGTNYFAGTSYILPSTNITLYAIWNDVSAGSVTVTFDANGGSGPPPTAQTGNIGASITLPNAGSLTKENHTFGGWNTNVEGTGTNYSAGASYILPSTNITLYAIWNDVSAGSVTVTFNANGGSGSPPSTQTGNIGASITLPNAGSLTKENHAFGGWNTNAGGTGINYPAGESFTLPNADITLYAKWDNVSVKTTRKETKIFYFGDAPDWPLLNNIVYPATIEIYALGAGGGGQGGHSFYEFGNKSGSGGAGGGGAAAYMKFTASEYRSFDSLTVGQGGAGGTGTSGWGTGFNAAGYEGGDGHSTSLTWYGYTLTVAGGFGGYGGGTDRKNLSGGSGGTTPTRPSNIDNSNWSAAAGNSGGNGEKGTNKGDLGGLGGLVTYRAGKGGRGGYGNTKGGDGENGRVIVVVTWEE